MKNRILSHMFTIDLYETTVVLLIGDSIEIINKHVNDNITKVDLLDTEGCVFENHLEGRFQYYIVLVKSKLTHNLIAHEVFHLSSSVLRTINITDEEATAWVIGYITELLYDFLKSKQIIIE
jgi:hypothetical protein